MGLRGLARFGTSERRKKKQFNVLKDWVGTLFSLAALCGHIEWTEGPIGANCPLILRMTFIYKRRSADMMVSPVIYLLSIVLLSSSSLLKDGKLYY